MPRDPYQSMSDGLARAKARQAPTGYEQQSQWTADLGGADDVSLMRIYQQREQDRIDAQNAEAQAMFQQTGGVSPPRAQVMQNMAGFSEGLQYNDRALGAKKHRIMSPGDLTSGMDDNLAYAMISAAQGDAGQTQNAASLDRLRASYAQPKRKKDR